MINRRHIRIKVMQSVYALLQSKNQDLKSEEKFLLNNIQKFQELYVLMLDLLLRVRRHAAHILEISKKKHLATASDLKPNEKFIKNRIFKGLEMSWSLKTHIDNLKLNLWQDNGEYIRLIWNDIEQSDAYETYMKSKTNNLIEDKKFIQTIYTDIIACNDKLYDFLEDFNIGWVDDFPFVNTLIIKNINKFDNNNPLVIDKLYKDKEDADFVLNLFRKVVLNHDKFNKDIDKKTPNWDNDRIAELDLILIKMALTEFCYFPSIPTKVSINEYLEIAKDYSSQKSSSFINGVLDKLLKEYQSEDKIKKTGRGLM